MKDKDKLIVVFYFNVSKYNKIDVPSILYKVERYIKFDDSVHSFVIPVYDGESRVECINPKLINEEDYKKVEKQLIEIKNKYNSFIEYELER